MQTTVDFLDALARHWGGVTDYRIAKNLGLRTSAVSQYRTGVRTFDDAMARRVAEVLGLDPAYVLACVHAERDRDEGTRQVWARIAARFAPAAAAVLVTVGLAAPSPADAALSVGQVSGPVYIMLNYGSKVGQ